MKRTITILALSILAITANAQRAYRAPVLSVARNVAGIKSAQFRFADHAEHLDAAWSIAWMDIACVSNLTIYAVAVDGSYSNALFSITADAAYSTNVTSYTADTFGAWPASDLLLVVGTDTNSPFTVRPGLKVTK